MQPVRKALGAKLSPADPRIPTSSLQNSEEIGKSLLFKPPSLQYFVTTATGNYLRRNPFLFQRK